MFTSTCEWGEKIGDFCDFSMARLVNISETVHFLGFSPVFTQSDEGKLDGWMLEKHGLFPLHLSGFGKPKPTTVSDSCYKLREVESNLVFCSSKPPACLNAVHFEMLFCSLWWWKAVSWLPPKTFLSAQTGLTLPHWPLMTRHTSLPAEIPCCKINVEPSVFSSEVLRKESKIAVTNLFFFSCQNDMTVRILCLVHR